MNEKSGVVDFKVAQLKSRKKKGWTQEEIEAAAKRELGQSEQYAKHEPEHLVSGDMNSILDDDDDDERDA